MCPVMLWVVLEDPFTNESDEYLIDSVEDDSYCNHASLKSKPKAVHSPMHRARDRAKHNETHLFR